METEKKHHKSGYEMLKDKYVKLELQLKHLKVELAEKNGDIERKAQRISELVDQLSESEHKVLVQQAKYNKAIDELFVFMGPIRRWLWDKKQTKK